eukprot:scaffold226926_cov19-Tisochrysis_lutea.AAC.1
MDYTRWIIPVPGLSDFSGTTAMAKQQAFQRLRYTDSNQAASETATGIDPCTKGSKGNAAQPAESLYMYACARSEM